MPLQIYEVTWVSQEEVRWNIAEQILVQGPHKFDLASLNTITSRCSHRPRCRLHPELLVHGLLIVQISQLGAHLLIEFVAGLLRAILQHGVVSDFVLQQFLF